tara:strand:+ start:3043 stop:3678 length:636 start_codon:yes stop_codon:yes gene_type:complete
MLFNFQQILKKSLLLKASCFLVFVLPYPALAVQPMSEADLEFVSATTGSNILNIFGASQAGLKIDGSMSEDTEVSSVSLNTENFNEGEATKPAALNKLRTIEEDNLQIPNNISELVLSKDTQNIVLKINEQTTGSASVFTTSSEINYKTSNVHHEMRNIEGGGVAVSRDLQIDLLKLENLRGDHMDESRSAGSIYISDWRSQGDTRIITSQ